jgi:ankyrin repeat protein
LHAAACWGHLEAVEILAQNGADISALTRTGETPFDITEDPDIKERSVVDPDPQGSETFSSK